MEKQAERFQKYQHRDVEYARDEPTSKWLHGALVGCLDNARYWSFFDEVGSTERMNRSLLLAAHAGTALFRAASAKDEPVQAWLDGPLEIAPLPPQRFTSPRAWEDSFYIAIACRAFDLVDQLASIPQQVSSPGSDQCFYRWVQTLQAFWRNDPNLPAYFDATHDDIANREFSPKRTIDHLLRPQVYLCQALLSGDPDVFNRELENTLQHHRKYWGTPANKHQPEGFLCLPAIAFAALAHGIGIPIAVQSGYLLQHQINRPVTRPIPARQQFKGA